MPKYLVRAVPYVFHSLRGTEFSRHWHNRSEWRLLQAFTNVLVFGHFCSFGPPGPETDTTPRRHLVDLRSIYGYRMFSGQGARDLKAWLEDEAETARSNEDLARRFVEECRRTRTVLPGISVIER